MEKDEVYLAFNNEKGIFWFNHDKLKEIQEYEKKIVVVTGFNNLYSCYPANSQQMLKAYYDLTRKYKEVSELKEFY